MNRRFILKIILGVAIPLASSFVIAVVYVCRMHGNLLEQGGFVQSSKVQVGPNVFLCRTSGRDVMLADEEGWGLVDGNIQRYAVMGENIYLGYVKRGEKAMSFGCYEIKAKTFRELAADEVERRGISGKWESVP